MRPAVSPFAAAVVLVASFLPAVGATALEPAPKADAHHGVNGGVVKRSVPVPARLRAKRPVHRPVNQLVAAERQGFKKVSDLVAFPPFFPGLGIVTVKPATLPIGPFRTFDHKGRLISTVYMIPSKDMDEHKRWDDVKGLPTAVDHATMYFHPGHPGVDMPHYHLVLWHVPKASEALVAK